jgi:YD repeat-containing protein
LRKLLIGLVICGIALFTVLLAGPVMSGALLLLLPADNLPEDHDLPESYQPFHKGGVDMATGLYVREDEDLVLRDTPALILRRTYLSNYRAVKQFGVGTTHTGEWYVVGDGEQFSWATLVLANGARVQFDRTSPGQSFLNAMYAHHSTPGEWQGARFGWTGFGWALRRQDGSLARFRACGDGSVCSLVQTRDQDGHEIRYRRNFSGRLLRMEASPDRWIAFDYDAVNRVTRAYSSAGDAVRYEYDGRGRLARVAEDGGTTRRYTYTDRDQMATIDDPEHTIENEYNAEGRCIRQVNRYPGSGEPFVFTFAYVLEDDRVVETSSTESDGAWSRFRFDANRYTTSETRGSGGIEPTTILYDRDQATGLVTGLTVTCPDRTGRPLSHRSFVKPGWEDWTRWDLLQTHCSSKKPPRPRTQTPLVISRK